MIYERKKFPILKTVARRNNICIQINEVTFWQLLPPHIHYFNNHFFPTENLYKNRSPDRISPYVL